jgi:hypothetical protein
MKEADMVSISTETAEQTEARLRTVVSLATLKIFDESYVWEEFPLHGFRASAREDALALVRDDTNWSQLVPADEIGAERFKMFRFHFPPNLDNSGFVGWLATLLKRKLGTGLFVTCGQNSADGGIYDYWGCPAELGDAVVAELKILRAAPEGAH